MAHTAMDNTLSILLSIALSADTERIIRRHRERPFGSAVFEIKHRLWRIKNTQIGESERQQMKFACIRGTSRRSHVLRREQHSPVELRREMVEHPRRASRRRRRLKRKSIVSGSDVRRVH